MRLLSPYNVEGKWSSAGARDQGHTRDGDLATEQLLRLGQSSTGIRLDARLSGMLQGPTGIECTDENRRHGRESAHRNPRPPTQGHQGKFVEVHWDTRVCCELRQVISRRSRTPTRTLHGRTCVQPEMDQAIYLGKNKVAPWSGAHPVN